MKNAFKQSERPKFYHDHDNLKVNVMKLESTETFSLVFHTYCAYAKKVKVTHTKNELYTGK